MYLSEEIEYDMLQICYYKTQAARAHIERVRIERKIPVFSIEKPGFSSQCGHAQCMIDGFQ